jgi:hypothetical protein
VQNLLGPLLLLGCSLLLTTRVATAQVNPAATDCSKSIGAPVMSSRAMPLSWMVVTESEELKSNGITKVLTRTELIMSVAFTPVACTRDGATLLFSINSIVCKVRHNYAGTHACMLC